MKYGIVWKVSWKFTTVSLYKTSELKNVEKEMEQTLETLKTC